MTTTLCPVCGGHGGLPFFAMPAVPVHCNVLHADATAARAAPRGDLRLSACTSCGMVWNTAFDDALLRYGPGYDASLDHSKHFRAYANRISRRLVAAHRLADGGSVVEIGCGNGYFLRLLAEHGARCTGYDAGYDGSADGEDGLTIHRRFYDPDRDEALDADLLVCRHVLEHIPRPGTFLRQILRAVRAGGAVYIEVPDAMFTLSSGGVWDLIYEHCNYFTESALGRLCRGHDLVPTRIVADYGDQFLCLDAGLHGCRAPESTTGVPDPVHVFACAERFATEFHAIVDRFAAFLADELGRGRRIALWGAGSKGVTFLNVVPHASEIQMVIDLNPRKHGRHVAGTAQKVSDPDSLCREFDADLVLVMNPNYTLEVEDELRARGSRAQVLAAV